MTELGDKVPRPDQVPHGPPRLVDRVDVRALLSGLLGREGSPWTAVIALSGTAGVGKSAVAYWATDDARARFPGGTLHIDYRTFQVRGEAAVAEALAATLRGLGVHNDVMPASTQERAAWLRTRSADKPMLVVIENVTEPAQVTTLRPQCQGSAVLVTGETRLTELRTSDRAELVELMPFDAAASAELLEELCGPQRIAAEPDAVAELIRICDGFPLALEIAARRLLGKRRITVAELVDRIHRTPGGRLAGLHDRGADVAKVFDESYDALPADARRLYRLLGLFPGPDFTVETAAVIGGVSHDEADSLIDVLLDASLLLEHDAQRFRFLDLVRLHAVACAERDEHLQHRVDALRAIWRHFLVRAVFADRATMDVERLAFTDHEALRAGCSDPFTGDKDERKAAAFGWFDAERANFLAVQRAANDHGAHPEVWQLAETLTAFYLNRRHLSDWIESSELGIVAARHCGHARAEARLRSMVSRAYCDLGRLEEAADHLEKARWLAEADGHLALQGSVWEFSGRYHDVTDDHPLAQAAYRRSRELNVRAEEWRGAALATYFLGVSLDASDSHEAGLAALESAHRELRELGDSRMAARALASLGSAQHHLGDTTRATRALEQAAGELKRGGYLYYEAQARDALYHVLGEVDPDQARGQLRLAAGLYRQLGSPKAELLEARLTDDG